MVANYLKEPGNTCLVLLSNHQQLAYYRDVFKREYEPALNSILMSNRHRVECANGSSVKFLTLTSNLAGLRFTHSFITNKITNDMFLSLFTDYYFELDD